MERQSMAEGKWIEGLAPEEKAGQAARQVLEARLALVAHWLPLAVDPALVNPHTIHQLRVSTRRADAAVRMFAQCIKDSALRAMRKTLRSIRRAAGAARDADVFLQDIADFPGAGPERPGLDFLLGYGYHRRAAARPALAALNPVAFSTAIPQWLRRVRRSGKQTLAQLAQRTLGQRLADFDTATRGNLQADTALHEVRIIGKRLRYSLELFAECVDPRLRTLAYPLLVESQDILGRFHDSWVALSELAALRADWHSGPPTQTERLSVGLEAIERFHRQRMPAEREAFRDWLPRWHSGAFSAI
jgi:CHAD domain-containing protein